MMTMSMLLAKQAPYVRAHVKGKIKPKEVFRAQLIKKELKIHAQLFITWFFILFVKYQHLKAEKT